jgi:eukaryotic-like serine/threonine-protein kinase
VLHQVGVGALGPVFRTYEPSRDRLVAVKVFRLDITPEQAQSLVDELGRAVNAGLVHPSIVEPVAAGLEGTVAYRAEEYVAAESLDVAMRHYAPAPLDKVLAFITQLASAIDSARGAGVGHGALHPRDIFVTPDEARATGFGVVDALDRLGIRAPVRRPYSPPERIAGQPWSTPADVFSLGAIAFELLTGRRPSGLGDQIGPLTGAAEGTAVDKVRAVLARAMHERPEERFPTAIDFASALDRTTGDYDVRLSVPQPDPVLIQRVSSPRPAAPVEPPVVEPEPEPPIEAAEPETVVPAIAEVRTRPPQPELRPFDLVRGGADRVELKLRDAPEVPEHDDEPAGPSIAHEPPTIEDSPREVARKVIAAREVRRRESKRAPQPALDLSTFAPEVPASAPEPQPAPAEALPLRQEVAEIHETEIKDEPVPDIQALREQPAEHRIVAVDEFRSRESQPPAAEPIWPIPPDPPGERQLNAPFAIEPFDPELPPPLPLPSRQIPPPPPVPVDEPAPERQRVVMLPLAVTLIVGLLIGYVAGYLVGGRDLENEIAQSALTTAPTTTSAGPSAPIQTPGTSGQAAAPKDFSEQAVAPQTPSAQSSAAPKVPVEAPAGAADKPTPKPDAPPPAAATTRESSGARLGRVIVSSVPSRAAVTVNGKWMGRTPLTLSELPLGTYVVRVVEPGYEVAREEFVLSKAEPTKTMAIELRRQPGAPRTPRPPAPAESATAAPTTGIGTSSTGEIFVDSRPRGARVVVDGKEYGVTPMRVTGQSVGRHVVRLELADHAPWTKTEAVTAGATARVTGSLERIR